MKHASGDLADVPLDQFFVMTNLGKGTCKLINFLIILRIEAIDLCLYLLPVLECLTSISSLTIS